MDIDQQLESVFREVFDDDALLLTDDTTAADVEAWDSVMHVNLVFAVEERFGIRFRDDEIGGFEDYGALRRALRQKLPT
jgi:acyl carrier protein